VTAQDGPYLPGSAIKGALRTGMLFSRWMNGATPDFERLSADRPPWRRSGEAAEDQALGPPSTSFMRAVSIADSRPVAVASLKVYMLRVSTLEARGAGRLELGWKQAPRGTVPGNRPDESTPQFAEMASPGTSFEGSWRENAFLAQPEVARMLRWREPVDGARLLRAANDYAARLLGIHKQYAAWTRLAELERSVGELEGRLEAARSHGDACLLALGWGSGLLAKTGWLDTDDQAWRQIMRQVPLYGRAIESGLPFPKTRRIVFQGNQPAALPGWALLEIG
jgi:CRISPR-associated protein Csm5